MGRPYNELIPEAILLDNPGITREEFVQLLNETRSSSFVEYSKRSGRDNAKWKSHGGRGEDFSFHRGLHGLAKILCLESTQKFKNFYMRKKDDSGLVLYPPNLDIISYKKKGKWIYPKFKVTTHIKNILSEARICEDLAWGKLKVGKYGMVYME